MDFFDILRDFYKDFKQEKGILGYSTNNLPLYYFCVEKSSFPVCLFTYSIHAREYITTYLAYLQIQDFIKNGKAGKVYFLPAINPDGIKIVLNGNGLYKANANGVDLNVNFDAKWGSGEFNTKTSGYANFIGDYPFSERETKALKDFTLFVKPHATVSYHSKGEEIYWEFYQDTVRKKRDYSIAKALSNITGYPLIQIYNSAGGYKDWCIEKLKIPAYTIEVGENSLSHPIKEKHIDRIYNKNKGVVYALINGLKSFYGY